MEHSNTMRIDRYVDTNIGPVVRQILMHLCESDHPSFGSIVEWCESRGDCSQAVVCPHCNAQFVLDDEEMTELRLISLRTEEMLSCGVVFD
jgi:hypothetical protein